MAGFSRVRWGWCVCLLAGLSGLFMGCEEAPPQLPYVEADIRSALATTAEGKEMLKVIDDNSVKFKLRHEPERLFNRSGYKAETNEIVINTGHALTDTANEAASAIGHEIQHVKDSKGLDGRSVPDPANMTKQQYQDEMVARERNHFQKEREFYDKMKAAGANFGDFEPPVWRETGQDNHKDGYEAIYGRAWEKGRAGLAPSIGDDLAGFSDWLDATSDEEFESEIDAL